MILKEILMDFKSKNHASVVQIGQDPRFVARHLLVSLVKQHNEFGAVDRYLKELVSILEKGT